jgi:signal transduction histidine kinase
MRYEKHTGRFYFFNYGNENSGTSEQRTNLIHVHGVCSGGNNVLFLLSDGLYRYNYADSSLKSWHQADGLAADAIATILKDLYENVWLVGQQDATILNPKNNELTNFRFSYDANNYGYANTSIPLSDGNVCIAIGGTLAICNPDVIQKMKRTFSPVLISDFSVFEKSIPFSQRNRDVRLSYKQNFFSISFSSFSASDDLQYAYKLEGFDHDWVYGGSRKFASYTNVPGGDYTFHVKAGAHGKWSEPTQIRITVVPPFWKTAWFEAIVIIACLGLVYLVFRLRVQTIKRQQEQRLQLHTVRDKIARDLHDDVGASLSSIRMYSEAVRMQVKEKVPEADMVLGRMSENAREIVENMADIVWAINPQNDSLQFMEDRMHAFVAAVCGSKNIVPHFNQINFHELKLPMEMRKNVFLIFKEAVNNSAKYSQCKNLYLHLQKSEHILKLLITDDGKGFDETNIVFGNGLQSMKKRAAEIGGNFSVHSKPGEGTTVELILPLP